MKKTCEPLRSMFGWLTFSSIVLSLFSPLPATAMSLKEFGSFQSLKTKNQTTVGQIDESDRENIKKSFNISKNRFEENRGQFDKAVRFASRRPDQSLFLTATEAVFTMPSKVSKKKSVVMRMQFNRANENSTFTGLEAAPGKTSYFRGSDAGKWQSEVSTFGKVKYEQLYKGVDLLWYNNEAGEMEYDFIVAPNADHRQVELKFKGAKKLEIGENGDLLIRTNAGTLRQRKPFTYQTIEGVRREVASRYRLNGKNKVRFVVGNYDRERELVIDPAVIPYSTYLGGSGSDLGNDIAVDNQGSVYIVGTTRSTDFPATGGAHDTTINGSGDDTFVTKFDANGALVYSTYIGGTSSYSEKANGIAVDGSGNAYIIGSTVATDFPITPGAFSQTKKGSSSSYDAFVTKINANGSALVYSTFLGGLFDEEGRDIAVDSSGNANVVGKTNSYSATIAADAFPVTAGSLAAPNGGGFYSKLNASGSGLVYSTYLSGTSADEAIKVAMDAAGSVYVTGLTTSTNFPTTSGAFDTTYNGNTDFFVAKFSSGGSLQYSTFLGGTDNEGSNNGFGLAVDDGGNCYILGPTGSDNFPTTAGALDRTRNNYEAFVAKLNPQGSALVYSTFLSPLNNGPNYGYALAADAQGNAYVLGKTGADSFAGISCYFDRYIAQIAPDGSAFKGVSCYEQGFGESQAMVIDSSKNLYTTGYTSSNSYPTTANAFDKTQNGFANDAVYTKHRFINTAANSDYDGDGKSDPSVYRDGTWHLLQSTAGYKFAPVGLASDVQTPADFDGDGKTDIAFWRPGLPEEAAFYIYQSSNGTVRTEKFGQTGDDPTIVGDYDGDGKADIAVYRSAAGGQQSYFYYRGSKSNPANATTYTAWGASGDKAAVGDYNADGKSDFAVFRPSEGNWYILNNDNASPQNWRAEKFGLPTDKLVPADYDGDAKTDIAVFRPSNGTWYIKQSSVIYAELVVRYDQWGLETDTPVPADYDGDGKADVAVWRNGAWYFKQSSNGSANLGTVFGLAGDKPVQSNFVH